MKLVIVPKILFKTKIRQNLLVFLTLIITMLETDIIPIINQDLENQSIFYKVHNKTHFLNDTHAYNPPSLNLFSQTLLY